MESIPKAENGIAVIIDLDSEVTVKPVTGEQVAARKPGTREIAVLDNLNSGQCVAHLPTHGRGSRPLRVEHDRFVLIIAHQPAVLVPGMPLLGYRRLLENSVVRYFQPHPQTG